MPRFVPLLLALSSLQIVSTLAAQAPPPPPKIAQLGTCEFAGGATLRDCRIAYRTFGKLNAARTNGVLVPTWLLGRSEDWIQLLGPEGLVDTTRFYAILVDAFGNGRSSSPSNSSPADRSAFRNLTIADMVEAQHRLVVDHLKLPRLHAVMGISMGGFQSFEWAVRYPEFMDVVIPIVGSPRLGAFDYSTWTTVINELRASQAHGISVDSTWTQLIRIMGLVGATPRAINDSSPAAVERDVAAGVKWLRETWTLEDFEAQLGAALRQDVSSRFGGDMSRAAARVRAPMLIVYSWDDHMVTAESAVEFAKYVKADTLSVPTKCGHGLPSCESKTTFPVVRRFLERGFAAP
jgi:homoserine O-acetyltransferase/O-succinyltransferase